jgi:DNA-binding response OmpR family regulator
MAAMVSLEDDINTGAVTGRMRALAADIPLSVLIFDWQMPVMDGIEFTEKFRAGKQGETYLIMLTSRKEDFDYERGYRAGVDDYLTKGVREPELIARIHAGLHTFSLRVQLRETRAALALASKRRDGG